MEDSEFFPKNERYVFLFVGGDNANIVDKRNKLRAMIKANLIEDAANGKDLEDDDVGSYPTKSSQQSQLSETGSTVTELGGSSGEIDGPKEGRLYGSIASQGSTPRLTPP
ncbi:hypothetical protein Cni_G14289 [Canna indica]|uniref:Uncharacterized protein n=1 Tax=Canna indica TaxID=4628 RepID=A0AAQ3KBS6_9LILI|nr:hypothetical protein Cni_G14289 [Canna indica]